jgi:hypothetical protein
MLRGLIEEILLFFLPFAAFAAWLIFTKRNPLDIDHWGPHRYALSVIGVALVIVALLWAGLTQDRFIGVYEPARVEDGRLVPGGFRERP